MMPSTVYDRLIRGHTSGRKKLHVLLDPDELRLENLERIVELAQNAEIDSFFIGGSIILKDKMEDCLERIKASCNIPLILFPGNVHQVSYRADAILFLSLISGRNPEMLIGQHVVSAPMIKESKLEVIPTGYLLVDGGKVTSVQYMSGTTPIPHDKPEIAVCTAMAGEMLGLKLMYMDAGSGAQESISNTMIKAVSEAIDVPLIVGGGIRDAQTAYDKAKAGADGIVVGNAIEKSPTLITELSHALKEAENYTFKSLS